jgi:hypothetical protein
MRWPVLLAVLLIAAAPAQAAECPGADAVRVPGAELQQLACLDDLTTAGTSQTGHTDPSDYAGLTPSGQRNPSGVPGLQVDGYFPDTSTSNGTHGWFHDAQFVIRLPEDWNGKLVVTGAPGIRKQYSVDPVIGDFVLAAGYAYAATDKGNGGTLFYRDGQTPGDAVAEWNMRVTELAEAAQEVVYQYYGRTAVYTYATGISNGGYLTRWQLENHPEVFSGGVDWEGTLFQAEEPNLLTYLPVALRYYPQYAATQDPGAHAAMIKAGFAPGSEFLWPDHYAQYWDLTQRTYREEFDPGYDGELEAGVPHCPSGVPMCDADYDYDTRPDAHAALAKVALTGDIRRPMLTLHGTYDSLLPIATDSDVYTGMIRARGHHRRHRYYVIEHGNHVDGRYDLFPDQIQPMHPCWREAFDAMTLWVEQGQPPPPSQLVPDRRDHDVVNTCKLSSHGPAAGPRGTPPPDRLDPRVVARAHRKRRRLVVRGRLRLPRGITRSQGCGAGRIDVRLLGRTREVARGGARLTGRCRFVARVRVRAPRRVRAVQVRFSGNRALYPARTFARIR